MFMMTQQLLHEKVGKLFRSYGIKSVSMDDIARELGMSKKTLYQQVSDKNDLIWQVLPAEFQQYKKIFLGILTEPGDAVLQLLKLNTFLYSFLNDLSQPYNYDLQKYYPGLFDQIRDEYEMLFLPALRQNLVKGKSEGVFRYDLNEDIISRLFFSRLEQIPHSGTFSPDEYKSPGFVMEISRYHLHGIINKTGEKLLEKYSERIENNIIR